VSFFNQSRRGELASSLFPTLILNGLSPSSLLDASTLIACSGGDASWALQFHSVIRREYFFFTLVDDHRPQSLRADGFRLTNGKLIS